ncbi:ATP-dependent RNA helicase dbp6 [Hypoxylon texense]
MAELVGFVASTITVAGIASTAASKLKRLWDEVQNVPETITDLVQQIEILESHIGQIESEINERGASTNPIFNDPAVRLSTEYCRECIESLASIIDELRVKIDTQKNPKRTLSKMRVVLKKQVLAHFEGRLQKAVSLLGLTQQGYMMTVWDIQVAKATSGWKAKLRVWRVAPDSLAIKAIKDDDYDGLRDSLAAGHATPFDRTQTGDTLLHLAAQHANHKIIDLLVGAGLGFDEKNDGLISVLRRFVYQLQQSAGLSDMLDFLTSQGAFENPVYDCVASANRIDIPMLAVVDFIGERESPAPDILMIYQSYILPRLQDLRPFVSTFFVVAPGDWSPQDARILVWKDGRIREGNISRAMDDGLPIWNLLAYSMGTSESLANTENLQKWQSYISQDMPGITNSMNLHNAIDVPGCQPWLLHNPQSPLTPLLWLLLLTLDSWHAQGHLCNSFEEVYSPHLKPALRRWLTLLKSCGVDLEEYGTREQDLLQSNRSVSSYDWKFRSGYYGPVTGESVRLRNIVHGANVDDWELVWDIGYPRHCTGTGSCEPHFPVPGGWPDEAHRTEEA